MEENTTLERKLSPMNVWALALGSIIGWGAFVMPGNTFLPKAGPLGTAIAMTIAAFGMIIIAFNYNYMINKYPVAGGEFTYAKMAFGRKHAFICSWFLGLSYLTIVPLNATALALIGRNLFDVFEFGFHYTVAGYDVYFGEILLAIAALTIFAILSIKGIRFTGAFQTLLVFALVIGVIVITIAAVVNPKIHFSNLSPGFNSEGGVWGIFSVVAVAPWAFVGFDTVPQAAEEFRFSHKKTKLIMILSILFGAAVYVDLNTVTAAVIPDGYQTWDEYITAVPNLNGLISLPTFHAAYQLLGYAGLVFLGMAVLAAVLSGIIGFYMATSRLLYSMAKEKVIPGWFGVLDKEYHTPKNSIFFVFMISIIAPFFGRTALGWIVDMSSIGATIGYGYTSLAAYMFAKEDGNRLIMNCGIIGTIMAVMFSILLLVPIPKLTTSLGKESYVCLAIWSVIGIVFYITSDKT